MTSKAGKRLRLFLAGAALIAGGAAALVFSGVWPVFYKREFSENDFAPQALDYALIAFDDIQGWRQDDPGPALEAFVRSCETFEKRGPDEPANPMENLGPAYEGRTFAGTVADWLRPCSEARALLVSAYSDPGVRRGALRAYFEFHFRPVRVFGRRDPKPDGRARNWPARIDRTGLFTGYYEPVYRASRMRTLQFSAPVLPRPDDLIEVDLGAFRPNLAGERIAGRVANGRLTPYPDRKEIEAAGADAPLAFVDPNDLFFLQIQGSGRLVFAPRDEMRVGYDGQNGHPYTAIGRVLVARGIMPLETVTMQRIRQWLDAASPEEAKALRDENASYVFFRPLDQALSPDLGPPGAQGAALTPGRSLAVDRRYTTLGAPVWIDVKPEPGAGGGPIRRLMIAQDTGGAIKGPVRGDVFWGSGPVAGDQAGAMRSRGAMIVLLPRRVADALAEPGAGTAP
ncbi:MAG: MltA domain-containing protein [Parvularculaceae bacterium]